MLFIQPAQLQRLADLLALLILHIGRQCQLQLPVGAVGRLHRDMIVRGEQCLYCLLQLFLQLLPTDVPGAVGEIPMGKAAAEHTCQLLIAGDHPAHILFLGQSQKLRQGLLDLALTVPHFHIVVDHVDAAVAAQIPFFERHSIKSSCIDCDRRGAECAPRLSGAALHSDLDVVLPCPVAEELPLVACD